MNDPVRRAPSAPVCRRGFRRAAGCTATVLLGAVLLAGGRASAATLFASPGGSGAACTSPATPCSLCDALGAAADGDIIYLAGGTFTGACGASSALAPIDHDLQLLGGWSGTATTPPSRGASATTLDGEGARRVVAVAPGRTLLLDGLTIDRGFDAAAGGGVLASGADLTLNDVTVKRCVAGANGSAVDARGGGVAFDGGDLLVRNSTFLENWALCSGCSSTDGGAIAITDPASAAVERSRFEGNYAWWGKGIFAKGTGASPALTVRETTFTANQGGGYGGAMGLQNVDVTIVDSAFRDNSAGNDGGTIMQAGGSLTARRTLVTGGSSYRAAGFRLDALSGFSLENCIFADNVSSNPSSDYRISALKVGGGFLGGATLRHNTFVGPDSATPGIGLEISSNTHPTVTMQNNIVARLEKGVSANGGSEDGPQVLIDGTLWGSGAWAVTTPHAVDYGLAAITASGDLSGDPAFVDASTGNYHIGPASAARDQGVAYPGGPMPDDVDTVRRDAAPDRGADEYLTRVRVGAPNGGETLRAGAPATLKWDAPSSAMLFDVFYSPDKGATWSSVKKNLAARTFEWTVPRPAKNVAKGLVKVVARKGSGKIIGSDSSDKAFRVEVVRLTSPNGGEILAGGVPVVVTWETNGTRRTVNKVQLCFTLNGGTTWKPVSPAPAPWNPGSATWTPPVVAAAKSKCKVKVVLKSAGGDTIGTDESDAFFRVQ